MRRRLGAFHNVDTTARGAATKAEIEQRARDAGFRTVTRRIDHLFAEVIASDGHP